MNCKSCESNLHSKLIQIFLRLDDGNGYQLLVEPDLTLEQLTSRIERCPLVLPDRFILVYMGQPLNNLSATLKDLNLHQKSIIHIENISPNSPKCLKIDVCVYFNQETTVVNCMKTDTIYDLKQKLKKVTNTWPKHQILVFRGIVLHNQKTIEDYHIKANSLICLTVEDSKKESEFSPVPSLHLQNSELKEQTNSVILKERKNSKEMFRSEVFPQRPAFQIEIREKDNLDDTLFKRQFSFKAICPQLSQIVIGKQPFQQFSSKLSSSSEDCKDQQPYQSRMLFKKVTIN